VSIVQARQPAEVRQAGRFQQLWAARRVIRNDVIAPYEDDLASQKAERAAHAAARS
jgi:hypothetical protein